MNTIFIDIKDIEKNIENSKVKGNLFRNNKLVKYIFVKDVLNNDLGKKLYIEFDVDYLNKMCIKKAFPVKYKFLKYLVKKCFTNDDTVNLVFSNFFDENTILKEYIIKLLKQNSLIIYDEITKINQMKEHDIIYVDEYIDKEKIRLNKLKILFVIDNINDYDDNKIREYISKFKFVDVLKCNNLSKSDNKKLNQRINDINNEYGTTIEIIQKRNISMYHVYVVFSKISKLDFIEKYILRKRSMYIDLKDPDEDVLSDNVIAFNRYKQDIQVMFNRMNMVIENFSINKLGNFSIKNNR